MRYAVDIELARLENTDEDHELMAEEHEMMVELYRDYRVEREPYQTFLDWLTNLNDQQDWQLETYRANRWYDDTELQGVDDLWVEWPRLTIHSYTYHPSTDGIIGSHRVGIVPAAQRYMLRLANWRSTRDMNYEWDTNRLLMEAGLLVDIYEPF